MSKLAIDIALIPPEEILDICVAINQKPGAGTLSSLNKIDNLPHITLAMAVVERNQLPEVGKRVKRLITGVSPLKLAITELRKQVLPNGKDHCYCVVKPVGAIPESRLRGLHTAIMEQIMPLSRNEEVTLEMFYQDPNDPVQEVSSYWVRRYKEAHSDPEDFNPHISLKCQRAEFKTLPVQFTASRLAICHLGNYCTCRQVFNEFKLQD